jgi:hypothetical protein
MADGDESTTTSGGPRKLLLPAAPGPAQPLTHLGVRFRKKLDASLSSQGYTTTWRTGAISARVAQIKVLDLARHPGLSAVHLASLPPERGEASLPHPLQMGVLGEMAHGRLAFSWPACTGCLPLSESIEISSSLHQLAGLKRVPRA